MKAGVIHKKKIILFVDQNRITSIFKNVISYSTFGYQLPMSGRGDLDPQFGV